VVKLFAYHNFFYIFLLTFKILSIFIPKSWIMGFKVSKLMSSVLACVLLLQSAQCRYAAVEILKLGVAVEAGAVSVVLCKIV